MGKDAKWTVGIVVPTILAATWLLASRIDSVESRVAGLEARIDAMESRFDSRLLSIEEHLRAAPAPALPDAPHQ